MSRVRVKICGITSEADALKAVEAGADALGFMFYEGSPRNLSVDTAAGIIHALPPFVARVGVFVNASLEIIQGAATAGLDTVQLHGDETPEFCRQVALATPLKVVKALRVRDGSSLAVLPSYTTSAWLLDSYVPGQLGGTGARFNWDLACDAVGLGRPVILAGGLNPKNAAEAARQVRPFALDVSSGVELSPGKKDANKVRDFIAAVRGV
ncbi:MAG TPA: phosphoribosylanthranilate isomerase [Verrucomicrobiae bacterium]|nr:phosphoribosylanthranilate isomerase [Verrucomicrobiae bacterium]